MDINKEELLKRYLDGLEFCGCSEETEQLMTDIGLNLMNSPGSTKSIQGFAFEGGLLLKILTMNDLALKFNKSLPVKQQVNPKSLIKASLLAFIGSHDSYVSETSDWHVKNGTPYKFNDETHIPLRVGEKSVKLCADYGVKLTMIEYAAILNLFKDEGDLQSEYNNNLMGDLLKCALKITINLYKTDARTINKG